MTRTLFALTSASCVLFALGCQDAPAPVPSSSSSCADVACGSPRSALTCPQQCFRGGLDVNLDACAAGASGTDVVDETVVAMAFAQSLDGLYDGVELVSAFASDAASVLIALAEDPSADPLRAPFSFDGAGSYTAALAVPGSGSATVKLRYAKDYVAHSKGDLIVPDFFSLESYLHGATVSLGNGEGKVSYQSTGPLVEMLGLGPTPPNPFVLGLFDTTDNQIQVVDAELASREVHAPGITVDWRATLTRLVSEPDSAGAAITIVPNELSNLGTKQSLVITTNALFTGASDFGPTLRGSVSFRVVGGSIPYRGVVVAQNGRTSLTLSCAP